EADDVEAPVALHPFGIRLCNPRHPLQVVLRRSGDVDAVQNQRAALIVGDELCMDRGWGRRRDGRDRESVPVAAAPQHRIGEEAHERTQPPPANVWRSHRILSTIPNTFLVSRVGSALNIFLTSQCPSCPRKRASRGSGAPNARPWIPAFAGMTK